MAQASLVLLNSNYPPASDLQEAGTIRIATVTRFTPTFRNLFGRWARATVSASQLLCDLINHFSYQLFTMWPPVTRPPTLVALLSLSVFCYHNTLCLASLILLLALHP